MTKEEVLNVVYDFYNEFDNDGYEQDFLEEYKLDTQALDTIIYNFVNCLMERIEEKYKDKENENKMENYLKESDL